MVKETWSLSVGAGKSWKGDPDQQKKMLNYIIRSKFTTFFQIIDPG